MKHTSVRGLDRREFLKQASLAAGCAAGGLLAACSTQGPGTAWDAGSGVQIVCDPLDPIAQGAPAQWAVNELIHALSQRGLAVRVYPRVDQTRPEDFCIVAAGRNSAAAQEVLSRAGLVLADAPEALAISPGHVNGRPVLLAAGRDARGLSYVLTDLADAVRLADNPGEALVRQAPHAESPANGIRSAMRLFVSDVEDKAWFNDRAFWQRYLTMLASQRFNRFNLALGIGYDFLRQLRDTYFYFAYPFLVSVPGYSVQARGLPEAERDSNLRMLRFISDEAAARGLHFQLGLWTHGYTWTDSPNVNYVIDGLLPTQQAHYCRDALQMILEACPSIRGVTFRIHGESGVAEGNYQFWGTVFDGVVRAGRPIEIDMHAKGIDQGMIDVALATGMPVNVSPKFWAEHMGLPYHQASIRPLEMPPKGQDRGFFARSSGSRSFLRYGYGDLLTEDRRYGVLHRIWPGTQRLLLWGDPQYAAEYSRAMTFCGSAGVEVFEPLSFKGRKGSGLPGGRDGYADAALRPPGEAASWEKYLYTYRLWGRMLYNPATPPEVWRRQLRRDWGPAADAGEAALAKASRILPLVTTAHDPSAANNDYWPEMYWNQSLADTKDWFPYGDTMQPPRFGTVSPLDPQLFARVEDFAEDLLRGQSSGKISPLEVAGQLESWAQAAAADLAAAEGKIGKKPTPAYRRMAVDAAILCGLGRFFAGKLRAGVLWAIYDRTGEGLAKKECLKAYRAAREAWADLAARAEVYRRDITFGAGRQLRGHWADRLAAIDKDIALVESRVGQPTAPSADAQAAARAVRAVLNPAPRPQFRPRHVPPKTFHPGVALRLALEVPPGAVSAARLWYRQVNQAESFRAVEMDPEPGHFIGTIPAEYAGARFPLQYYFELRDSAGGVGLYPGFGAEFCGQPYFVVRRA